MTPCPTLLLEQGCLEQVTQHHTMYMQLLKTAKEGDSIASLGSFLKCSVIHTIKKCFPVVIQNLLCLSFVPTASCLISGHH